jgi:putative ABC transport system permease protein
MDLFFSAITQGFCYAAMALGIFLTLKIFNIPDITTDGSYTLGGSIAAILLSAKWSLYAALPVVLIGGALSGMATGLIHTRLKLHPLLAGILVMTALYSINLTIMGRPNIPLLSTDNFFGGNMYHNFFKACTVTGVLLLMLWWLLKTDFGIAMRATGNSEQMVKSMGVNTDAMKITGLALANALTALSGFMMVQFQGFSDINMGIGIVVAGLAAVILGDSIMKMFKQKSIITSLTVVVIGSVVFRLLLALALLTGLQPQMLKLLTALLVLGVAALLKNAKAAT